ncbi:MAG TPA: tRNA 2-thiouridine(34) synthase MnmA [Steroidobacteraceae bacterium]|nr:tRNA 2-thiouridine(34) synthase MnmA [Steroidobacteraceae bacterium]
MNERASRIVVGLSGGVDSAVAALRLVERGCEVHGLFMANWEDDDGYCTAAQDFQDARAVAGVLGIPLHRVDFSREYRDRVFAHFLAEYEAGRTPNPDVLCNREIKFGVCLAHARRLGAGRFATGHYAQLHVGDGPELHKGSDPSRDQSYFLHSIERAALACIEFPIGALPKDEVRARARAAGLPVYDKPDSTGICFIGERPFREFLSRYIAATPGPIETPAGERVGIHHGLAFYTLGQRGGLEVGGRAGHVEGAWYVARKDRARNSLMVVQGHDHPLLLSRALVTGPMHWLAPAPVAPFQAKAKVRYRQADQAVNVMPLANGRARLEFDLDQRAVTPGQYAVLYEGTRCLGGGVIEFTSG